MLCFGIWRVEAEMVLSKAIKLCLECVGISQIKFHIFHPPCKRIRAQNPQQNVMRDFASFFIILPNTAKPYSFVSGFSYTPNNKMPLL